MNDDSYSTKLRNLAKDYYQNHISFNEYRSSRKTILDQIDEEFNGRNIEPLQPQDAVEPSSLIKTVAFFANSDLDDKDDTDKF